MLILFTIIWCYLSLTIVEFTGDARRRVRCCSRLPHRKRYLWQATCNTADPV